MYTIRPFEPTDAEYESVVAVYNAAWPDDPSTVENWKHNDTHRDPQYLHRRFVIENQAKLVATGSFYEISWSHQPGKYGVDVTIHPSYAADGLERLFYDFAMDQLFAREPRPVKFVSDAREDQPDRIEFLQQNGFAQTMRYPRSELDINEFDPAPFEGIMEKLRGEGIEIVTLTELISRDPDWKRRLYELEWEIDQDMPSLDAPTRPPFEQFEKKFIHPNFRSDGWFIAVEKGECVGLSNLWTSNANPLKIYVGLTGVARSHRRRGIATAVKLPTIDFARSVGARYISTDNEENNPMYQLNLKLGFRPMPAWLDFEKRV
ncbi:MAG: GNAT family N-acetyltransferase [Caldilineaceae bacterium]|nr:GNAT family N-acetyltransferase [Caldilineaceae bacterium]